MTNTIWRHIFSRGIDKQYHFHGNRCVPKLSCLLQTPLPRQQRNHSSTSRSNHSIDNCPYRPFAKNHPDAARRVLAVHPSSHTDYLLLKSPLHQISQGLEQDSLERYLQYRGWDIANILSECHVGMDLVDSAVGIVSHPLTFSLTLG